MIAIVDYGMGNLRSVQKALEHLGYASRVTSDPSTIRHATRVILPGVGAFGPAMRKLKEEGIDEVLLECIRDGKPFLGICLGHQLLFERSCEGGDCAGLGVVAGDVVRFPEKISARVPHMGWNSLTLKQNCPLLREVRDGDRAYFVHSYFGVPRDSRWVAATCLHGVEFPAVISRDNVHATQFHPEKSGQVGMQMLTNFASL